jgi:transcriptional regulator with XRE-family HTH domain
LIGILNSPSTKVLILLRGPYSQKILSEGLHVSAQTITDWETGRAQPTPDNLRGLLKHFTSWTGIMGWPALDLLVEAAEEELPKKPTSKKRIDHT